MCLGELWFTATGMSKMEAVKLMLLSFCCHRCSLVLVVSAIHLYGHIRCTALENTGQNTRQGQGHLIGGLSREPWRFPTSRTIVPWYMPVGILYTQLQRAHFVVLLHSPAG